MGESTGNIGDSATSSPSKGQEEGIEDSIYEIDFRIRCAKRYCRKRQSLFESLHILCIFISLFGGSVAVGSAIAQFPIIALICGIIVAVIFAADSAIGFAKRAEKYNGLFKDFTNLLIKARLENPSIKFVITLKNEMDGIQKYTPSDLRVLDVLCHNQESMSQGIDDQYEIDFWHRLLMNVWKFENWQPKKLSNNHLVQNTSK